MESKIKAHITLLFANIIFGINYTVAKLIMPDYVKPYGLTVCRVLTGITLYWALGLFLKPEKIEKKDFKLLVLCAFLGVAMNQMLFLIGLNLTSPLDASIIMISTPILVLIIAALVVKEAVNVQKIAGILTGCAGAVLLILFSAHHQNGSGTFAGNLIIIANSLSYAFFLVIAKPLMKKYSPVTMMKWIFLFGAIFVFPVGYKEFMAVDWMEMPSYIWASVLFVVIASTFIAHLCNVYALKHLSPSGVSSYVYIQPVLTAIIAYFTLNEAITFQKIICALLVFAGVYLVSRGNRAKSL